MNFEKARFNMVEQQIRPWDVLDFDVLDALSDIAREYFVGEQHQGLAYADQTLPLPNGSHMLEPRIVARLVQGLTLKNTHKVLEIGTGSGYATAVLAKLAEQVISVDIDVEQQNRAAAALQKSGIENISLQVGDGLREQNTAAPFDAIYVGGAIAEIPETLKNQLSDNGRLVAVVGTAPVQRAILLEKNGNEYKQSVLFDTLIPSLNSQVAKAKDPFNF
ncbi:MAG: protein-L-isoaspartate O-methyltransferase [Neisseria sp.]|nr:protein-L-isoaspartate O-methyltransferase [Neisseria sp.]